MRLLTVIFLATFVVISPLKGLASEYSNALPNYKSAVERLSFIQEEAEKLSKIKGQKNREEHVKKRTDILLKELEKAKVELKRAKKEVDHYFEDPVVKRTYAKANIDISFYKSCYATSLRLMDQDTVDVPDEIRADIGQCKTVVEKAVEQLTNFLEKTEVELKKLDKTIERVEIDLRSEELSPEERKKLEKQLKILKEEKKRKQEERDVAKEGLDFADILGIALSLADIAAGIALMMSGDFVNGIPMVLGGILAIDAIINPPQTDAPEDSVQKETKSNNAKIENALKDSKISLSEFESKDFKVDGELIPAQSDGNIMISFVTPPGQLNLYRATTGELLISLSDSNISDPTALTFKMSQIKSVISSAPFYPTNIEDKDNWVQLKLKSNDGQNRSLYLRLYPLEYGSKVVVIGK